MLTFSGPGAAMTSVYETINQRLIADLRAGRKPPGDRADALAEASGRRDADDDAADDVFANDGDRIDDAGEAG